MATIDIPDVPNNSIKARTDQINNKDIEPVTHAVSTREKSTAIQFIESILGSTVNEFVHYIFSDIIFPKGKDMIYDAITEGTRRAIYRDNGRPAPRARNDCGNATYYPYGISSRSSREPERRRERRIDNRPIISSVSRRRCQAFQDPVVQTRGEAEEIKDKMYDILATYKFVSVADLYNLSDLPSSFTDNDWGWDNLDSVRIVQNRDGWIIEMPRAIPYPDDK